MAQDDAAGEVATTYVWVSDPVAVGAYTVRETNRNYGYVDRRTYEVDDQQTHDMATILVETDSESPVFITDRLDPSSLTISKQLVATDGADHADDVFTFTVTLAPEEGQPDVNGRLDDMEFVDNVATVRLRAGESKTATHLPIGATYTVVEAKTPGFAVSSITSDGKDATSAGVAVGAISKTKPEEHTAAFVNATVAPTPGGASVGLTANKRLTGRTLNASEFSFQLKDSSGKVLQTKTNSASGAISFDAIDYDAAGTHAYTISEVKGSDATITYDTHEAKVTVKVEEDSNGRLKATATYDNAGSATFTNAYASQSSSSSNAPVLSRMPVISTGGTTIPMAGWITTTTPDTPSTSTTSGDNTGRTTPATPTTPTAPTTPVTPITPVNPTQTTTSPTTGATGAASAPSVAGASASVSPVSAAAVSPAGAEPAAQPTAHTADVSLLAAVPALGATGAMVVVTGALFRRRKRR